MRASPEIMESKQSKLIQFSSTSMQDSSFKIPINIPPELITEILLKLPVNSLLQFRCVSKSWLDLISSPEFIKTHLNICANNKNYTHHRLMLELSQRQQNLKNCSVSSLLYDSVSTEAIDLNYPYKNTHKFPKDTFIVGSVNGLICFSIEGTEFFLWNPSIRKFKKLPDSIGGSFMYGFGYDELHDDYKIVGIDRYLGHVGLRHDKAIIFSLNSDSWTSVDNFQEGIVFIRSKGMFVNGKLYWTNNITRRLRFYNSWGIVSIDLADEKWEKVETPCYGEVDFCSRLCLGVLGSDLSLFCDNWSGRVDMWVMKDDGVKESWTRIVNLNRPDSYIANLIFPFFCKSNEGEILFDCGSFFMIYNPKDNLIKYREVTNCDTFHEANIYVESLIWPYSKDGAKDAATTNAHMKKIM